MNTTSKSWLILGVASFMAVLFVATNIDQPAQADDSYISYRYARNLAQGHGLVFNPGERVEGVSNFLWTLMIAGGIRLGFDAPLFTHWLALFFSGLFLLVSFGFAYRTHPSGYSLLVPFILLCSISFATWSLSGMETPLYAFLAVAAFWAAYEGKLIAAALLAGLCFWSRPDGALVGLVILGVSFIDKAEQKDRAEWFKALAVWGFCITFLTGFRLIYYGALVPNTFQAKVGGIPFIRGVNYLRAFYLGGAAIFLPLALFKINDRKLWPLCLFVIGHTLYVLAIGGDVFPHSRFFLAVLPLVIIMAVAASYDFKPSVRRLSMALAVVLWLLVSHHIPFVKEGALDAVMKHRAQTEKRAQRYASEVSVYGDPVACVGIGHFGYYSNSRILDMVGLVSPEVAKRKGTEGLLVPGHQASNPDWILSQNPSVIFIDENYVALPCQIEMLRHPQFRENYISRGAYFLRKDLAEPSRSLSSLVE